jgi:YVTN family beta-propeller protein/predicted outer membrane repeat protein
MVLASALIVSTGQASARTEAARSAATVEQVHAVYEGPSALVGALNGSDAHARALARADLNGDGATDVVAGYAWRGAGIVTVQRGNTQALAPERQSKVFEAMQQGFDPAWLANDAYALRVPEPVSYVEAGDFNHDRVPDVLAAAAGGGLYLFAGDGRGGFGRAHKVRLPGTITTIASGEFRAADGRPDLAIGVLTQTGPELLVYDGSKGVFGKPLRFALPGKATAIQFGGLDADPFMDLAVAAAGLVEIVHGWGRKHSPALASRIEHVGGTSGVRGIAIGHFIRDRAGLNEIAAAFSDGTVRLLLPRNLDTRPFTAKEIEQRARLRLRGTRTGVHVESLPAWHASTGSSWKLGRVLAQGAGGTLAQNLLTTANISLLDSEDLLVAEAGKGIRLVRPNDATSVSRRSVRRVTSALSTLDRNLDSASVVLPMPQKVNGERGLVVLGKAAAPTTLTIATASTITVDRTDDPSGAGLTAASACTAAANDCSLRGAIQFANANAGSTINLPDPNTIGGSNHTYVLSIQGANGCVIEPGATGNTIGDLELNQSTTITGAGAANTIIRQSGTNDRVLCLNEPLAADIHQSISGVTITGGRDTVFGGGGIVGGDLNNTLALDGVVVSNNQTTGHNVPSGGGGIVYTGGSLTITNSTIGGTSDPCSSCTALQRADPSLGNWGVGVSGGGVEYTPSSPGHTGGTGTLTVTGTTFSHNFSTGIGGGGVDIETFAFAAPGGIGSGSATISTTTFSNNQAANGGGMSASSLPATIATTSFTSNSASNRGGALYEAGGDPGVTLNGTSPSFVTMTGNTATAGGSSISTAYKVTAQGTNVTLGGGVDITGGGIWTNSPGSTISPTNLTILGGTFNANDSTTNVSGNFTFSPTPGNEVAFPGTFNSDTGTFNFNGSGAQSIIGPNSPTFNNLVVNKPSGTLTLGVNSSEKGNLTVTSGTYDLGAFAANRTAAGGTLTVSNGATLKIGGTNGMPTNFATYALGPSSTVEYESASTQPITAVNYGNLTSTSTGGRMLAASGTIGVAGVFTPGSNAYTVTGSTVNFNGSGAQTIPAFNYNNLTSSSTGARTLAPSGTIGVAGAFTPGMNAYTIGGSTVDFNGIGAQTVPAFNYNNLTISGARTANNVTLASTGTIGVAGSFNPAATFSTGNYVITGSTVDFNGVGAQTIPAFNYNNLTSSSTGARTLAGSGTIGVAGVFTPGTNAYTITGSTVNFNGSGAQTIPAFNYNNLTSSSTGARTLASAGTVGVAGVFTPGTNAYTITGSTVNFNGSGAQTIPAFNYNNLTSSSTGARTLASSGTIGVAGAFTPGTNAYTIAGSTVDFNGSGAQTIPAFNYNNLTSSSTGARTLASSGTIGIAGVFTPGTNAYTITGSTVDFNGSGAQTIPAFNYNNLTSSSTGARTLASSGTVGIAGTFTPGTNVYTVTGSTVDFNGSGTQTIAAFNYNNLTSSSTGARTLASSGTIGIAGTFTPGANAYTVAGSTVNFNGSGAQTIPAFNYNNLTGSSTGARTLASSGTVGVAGAFTPGTNAYTVTGSTVDFNGAGAQTIPAFNYNNLTSSSTGARTLASSGTIGIAGAFTPGTNAYTVIGSTVNFNGAGAQTIPAFNYNNLTSSSTGARTLASSGTIGIAGAFTPGTNVYTVTGSTVSFNGAGAQTIPAFTFNSLTDANTAATVALAAAVTVNGALTVNANAVLDTTTFVLTANGAYTNNGQIRHSASQALTTTPGPFNFADGLGVETTRLSGLSVAFGSTTANTAAGGANPYNACGALPPNAVRRFWQITPTTGGSALARFSFRNDEVAGGLGTSQLAVYRCQPGGGSWSQVGTAYTRPAPAGPAAGYSSVEATNVPFASTGATYVVAQGTPDLAVVKTNNVGGVSTTGNAWTWTLHVTNGGTSDAAFSSGQTILSDNLPNSGIAYGSASVANVGSGVTGGANISCAVASNDLNCTAVGGAVTLGTSNASFDVTVTATPGTAVTFANPRSGGSCSVDPNNNNAESNEGNNSCSDSVVVSKAGTTTTITSDSPDPSVVGQTVTVQYSVTSGTSVTPTGNVTVTDGSQSCTATVAAGQCTLTFVSVGSKSLTAAYAGDAAFTGSTSAAEAHQVNKADTTTTITSDSPDPSFVGQAVTIKYSVSVNAPGAGTPTGNVTVSDGPDSCTGTVSAGQCSISFPSAGSKSLTASYAGDVNFNSSGPSPATAHGVYAADAISVGTTPTGVAVSAGKAYVANQGSNNVSVIDLTQNPPAVSPTPIAVGNMPDAAALSADGSRLYVPNFGDGTLSIISTATNTVSQTVAVGSRPTGVVEVGGSVYVANLLSGTISVVDPSAGTVSKTISLPGAGTPTGAAPSGLAVSADGHTLYANDARNGMTYAVDLTHVPDPAVAGSVSVGLNPAYLSVAGTLGYVANPGSNSVSVLDLSKSPPVRMLSDVTVGTAPFGVVAVPSSKQVFVTNSGSNTLSVIDTSAAPAVAFTTATGSIPDAIALSPDQQTVVVSNEGDNTVSIFHVGQAAPAGTVRGTPVQAAGGEATASTAGSQAGAAPEGAAATHGKLGLVAEIAPG